jgi:hypothetical protein
MAEGFGTGLIEGMQAGTNQQMAQQGLMQGEQDLQMNALKIKQTEQALAQQKEIMQRFHALSTGPSASDPQGAMRALASTGMQFAEAQIFGGQPEAGLESLTKASKILENASLIDEHLATQQRDNATSLAGMASWVKGAQGPERQSRWNNMQLVWAANNPGKENKYAGKEPTDDLLDGLIHNATSKAQEAEMKLKDSQARREDAQTRLADATAAAKKALLPSQIARNTALAKAGHVTSAQQKQTDAVKGALDAIDDIQNIIKTNPDKTLTGVRGEVHAVAESVASAFGSKEPTPSRDMETSILFLKSQLQTALTGSSYSSKDKMALNAALADVQKMGMTGEAGERRLAKLKQLLQDKLDVSEVRPSGEGSAIPLDKYLDSLDGGKDEE